MEKEREVFRFGDGNTLTSEYGVQLEATFAGKPVILGFSVVKGDCPPLLSRHALTQLGVSFDCEHHVMSSKKLKVKSYGLRQTTSGHYLMDIAEFGTGAEPIIPVDFRLEAGLEACVWSQVNEAMVEETLGSGGTDAPRDFCASHVGAGELLPSMRRSRSPKLPVPQHPVRGGGPRAPAERAGDGDDQPPQLGGTDPKQCIDEELPASGAILPKEKPQGKSEDRRSRSRRGEQARTVPPGPGRGGDQHPGPHAPGDGSDCQVPSESAASACEKGGDEGAHGGASGLSHPLPQLQRGDCLQHDLVPSKQDDELAAREGRGGEDYARVEVEKESSMASHIDGERSGILVGALREPPSTDAGAGSASSDVKTATELESTEKANGGQGGL